MVNFNSLRIAFTFAGCFLGAGYVSGQEMWQFFVSFGLKGLFGLFLAILLLFAFGVLLMRLAGISGLGESEALIIRKPIGFLRAFIGVAEIFFLTGIAVIMAAGIGALSEQTIGVSRIVSSALFCILVFILVLGGHERMVAVFSLTVPLLVIFTVAVSAAAYIYFPVTNLRVAAESVSDEINPLLGSWPVSALTFVSYNLFSSAEILAPLGKTVSSPRRVYKGIALGCVILFVIALCIFVSLSLCPDACTEQLPMLAVAGKISPLLEIIYAFLLFLGMLGTATSSIVAAVHYIAVKTSFRVSRFAAAAAISAFVYAGSLLGFGELIGTVYPVCGYFGILALLCMLEHFIHIKIKNCSNK